MQAITLSTEQMRAAYESLQQIGGMTLPFKTSYSVMRAITAMKSEYTDSNKARDVLVTKLGTFDAATNRHSIAPDDFATIEAFNKEWAEIAITPLNLNLPPKFNVSDFGSISIQAYVLAGLAPLIDDSSF